MKECIKGLELALNIENKAKYEVLAQVAAKEKVLQELRNEDD